MIARVRYFIKRNANWSGSLFGLTRPWLPILPSPNNLSHLSIGLPSYHQELDTLFAYLRSPTCNLPHQLPSFFLFGGYSFLLLPRIPLPSLANPIHPQLEEGLLPILIPLLASWVEFPTFLERREEQLEQKNHIERKELKTGNSPIRLVILLSLHVILRAKRTQAKYLTLSSLSQST